MKSIAFIILTYNSEKYIYHCLKSVLDITGIVMNIFVIDNGSTDKSKELIQSFHDERIHLISMKKNYGTTITRNKGLANVTNEDYICILDSDTEINQDAILEMMDYLDHHRDVGLVGPSMKNQNDEFQIPYRKFPNLKLKLYKNIPIKSFNEKGVQMESYPDTDEKYIICDYLISACWLMPTSTFKKVGYLDERIFYAPEDVEYCIRIWKHGLKIVHLKNPVIIHHYQRISKKKLISKVNISHTYCLIRMLVENREFLKMRREM